MSDLTNTAPAFDLTGLSFDFSDLSDMPAEVQKKFEPKTRTTSGPSDDILLVAAVLNAAPEGRALTAAQMLVQVRRIKKMPVEAELAELTVRSWMNRAVDLGLAAKATGITGFCSLSSPNKASDEELAERKAKIAKAHEAAKVAREKAAAERTEAIVEEHAAEAKETGEDLLAGLGL